MSKDLDVNNSHNEKLTHAVDVIKNCHIAEPVESLKVYQSRTISSILWHRMLCVSQYS